MRSITTYCQRNTAPSDLDLSIDQRALRDAFSRFPTGVTVVTARDHLDRPIGVTISSFNTVSLHPPLVLWSLAQKSSSLNAFYMGSAHVIHVLAEPQAALAKLFSSKIEDRFKGLETDFNGHGIPMLTGCAAYFECTTEACYPAGDHVIVVSRIKEYRHDEQSPLLFFAGEFAVVKAPD
jgi:flavin reductase (DIM6/NTAB) family NADH-FMN oxidoreductase RutF